ncbi:hypothetical protein FACS1894158_05780 [Betaproteobacteria bacterium]|nr:hypothetical protein FACS1894158_05780 [Betaproteobacteria bacterium]GHU19451.1 hypothetical protein FACS189475_06690 [Betaproteobacteria bacterium]
MYDTKIAKCPICDGQGLILIVQEISSGEFYCCCDECESEWKTPDAVFRGENGTANQYGKYRLPGREDIRARGWEKFLLIEEQK